MANDVSRIRTHIVSFDFATLFIEELGWDRHETPLEVAVDGKIITLYPIAHKRGMVAYQCLIPQGDVFPDQPVRRKIEHQVARSVHEHLLVFTDADQTVQVWQWVKRETGKPLACREHAVHKGQTGEALAQKLVSLCFSLEEEEALSLSEVTRRVRSGFDVEKITKRFYDGFRKEHSAFLSFITGITDLGDKEWYGSVMLNRLMFVYFIQRKGFLDNDTDYLKNRMGRMQDEYGKDTFYSFYRFFLLRLFHEGLGGRTRTPELEKLLGRIPYFNGGFFEKHPVELRYETIAIPDEAFEKIFHFFEKYHWHLDERPLKADNEINPDVLGYIFEKYINQKQMGAYYTKEDITEYISRNTVIPFLLDSAKTRCRVAFENPGKPTVWDLLSKEPDRYIHAAVKHGVINENGEVLPETDLPDFVRAGMIDPKARMFDERYNLQQASAHDPIRLVTETWREYGERRKRCLDIREKLKNGDVRAVSDLITLNLHIRQFIQDLIETCEGPDLLRAVWNAVEEVTILDPTCGSGAFLFAAVNILEPLYEACLDRMKAFVDDLKRSSEKHSPKKYSDFRKVLERVNAAPNPRYFIFKCIILNNLYGVDIMEEAVEICKLRLFLKLVAQVEPDTLKENLGIEPLPDIDFNIRAGNTLVGYATKEDVRKAFTAERAGSGGRLQYTLFLGDSRSEFDDFEEQVALADKAFKEFHHMQVEECMDAREFASAKKNLREKLKVLDEKLNQKLAQDYRVKTTKKKDYEAWLKTHLPFHWFVEFFGILKKGGFDVIIGNPPYVEISKIKEYKVLDIGSVECGNIYCPMLERFSVLGQPNFRTGVIVPLSLSCTERMGYIREHMINTYKNSWVSHFSGDANPSKLFEGVKFRLDIFIGEGGKPFSLMSSNYLKWFAPARSVLFDTITYGKVEKKTWYLGLFPKIGDAMGVSVLDKILLNKPIKQFAFSSGKTIYVHRVMTMFIKCFDFIPFFKNESDGEKKSEDYKPYQFNSDKVAVSLLNSSTFFLYFVAYGDCFHCGKAYVQNFPFNFETLSKKNTSKISDLCHELMEDFKKNCIRKRVVSGTTGAVEYDEFWPRKSKPIIDQIDQILAQHYGFTDEELDFIVNYDIKYRMGRDAYDDEGDE